MTRSKKSIEEEKCVSEMFGADCDRAKMRLTGFVLGMLCACIASIVWGSSGLSSEAPFNMDFSLGASCKCLYVFEVRVGL